MHCFFILFWEGGFLFGLVACFLCLFRGLEAIVILVFQSTGRPAASRIESRCLRIQSTGRPFLVGFGAISISFWIGLAGYLYCRPSQVENFEPGVTH